MITDMDQRGQIREFLVSRRARISPQSAGLPVSGRKRRVPGLRREEVAALAGLSVDYYIRLERGGLTNASDEVLQAIAGALRLDAAEQAHLVDLARAAKPSASRALYSVVYDSVVDDSVRHAGGPGTPNVARFTFLDPEARRFWPDWAETAEDLTAHLRATAGADPADGALTELVDELSAGSDVFRELWARHDVRAHGRGVKRFRHPVAGVLELRYDHLRPAAEPGLTIITYTAEPGTPSQDDLPLLASVAA